MWSISSVYSDMGETLVHSIGLTRAKARISLKNLAYNHASPGPTEEVRYVSFPMNDAG